MIDEKQPAELPPVGSCLICGHEKPFGVWKADVGVCGDCRDKARARVETLPWGHSPVEPIVTLQLERDQALKEAANLRTENEWLEVQCAAMRNALQTLHDEQNGPPLLKWERQWNEAMEQARFALSSLDPGKALAERMKLLERVVAAAEGYRRAVEGDRSEMCAAQDRLFQTLDALEGVQP